MSRGARLLGRILVGLLAVIILVPLLAVAAADIALNTASGRAFAVRQINRLAGPSVQVAGLGGHFPLDVKLAGLTLADAKGQYASGADIELRWNPLELLHKHADIESLTAARFTLDRLPVPGAKSTGSGGGGIDLSTWRADIAHFAIGAATLPASIVGRTTTLAVTGDAQIPNLTQGTIDLNATAPGAVYRLAASLTPHTVQARLNATEAPGGLIGHYAIGLNGPLSLATTIGGPLASPRDAAPFTLNASIGAATVNATGTLDLNTATPAIDTHIEIPELAPLSTLAGQPLAGAATIDLKVAKTKTDGIAIALQSSTGLTAGPHDAPKLLGPAARLSFNAHWLNGTLTIGQADVKTATGDVSAAGTLSRNEFDINTHISVADISLVAPTLQGHVQEEGTIMGAPNDFGLSGLITGDITQNHVASGPFTVTVDVAHLPKLPVGTLQAAGALENFPLQLDAAFSRDDAGAAHVVMNKLAWRSLSATADLTLPAGATMPTGRAKFSVSRLADFAAFSPLKLQGSARGDFAHNGGQDLTANLIAKSLLVNPQLGPIDATLHAKGALTALAVTLNAQIPALMGKPAQIDTAAVLNLDARTADISQLTAAWRGLNVRLTAPASVALKNGIAVRHLGVSLNGAAVTLDGTLTPRLNARASISHLPLSIASLFAPNLKATGTLAAQAALSGTLARPSGPFSLTGSALGMREGPAAQLPPATLHLTGTLAGTSAAVQARLMAGPHLNLLLNGQVPLTSTGAVNAQLTGQTDLRLADPLVAITGYQVRGQIATDIIVTGTPQAPHATGTATLTGGSVENIATGLNLTHITAALSGDGTRISLQSAKASAGSGTLSAQGTIGLAGAMPIDLTLNADHATPIESDTVSETISAHLTVTGALQAAKSLAGTLTIDKADINIPHSLPPSVANLPIIEPGMKPPAPAPAPPPVNLDLTLIARNHIFVRGDGLFAELGGHVHITGTSTAPNPQGGFDLIRGQISIAGKNLQFTSGAVTFNGDGFSPALDLEATTTTSNNQTATLIVGGTAQHPTITLTSTPPLPSDEILAQLLFNQSTTSLTPFQAASLAAALAQLSGVGGGLDPLGAVRSRLGLDQLSLGGSGTGAPSLQAGRYVAPGVYVGATQSTTGSGTQANVQINLYKGLKLQTSTGTAGSASGSSSGASTSVGLTYQFNY